MTAATQIYSFTVLIPAQTDPALPLVTDISIPDASVVAIRWRVPPGPSGYMGFQITSDGAPVIPLGQGNYIVADDESAQWDIAGYQDSGSWQVTGYNQDTFDHSVYIDLLTVPPGQDVTPQASAATAPAPVANTSLMSVSTDVTTFQAGEQVPT
jgi:hypothetical protein